MTKSPSFARLRRRPRRWTTALLLVVGYTDAVGGEGYRGGREREDAPAKVVNYLQQH